MNIWVPRVKILENTREEIVLPGSRVSGRYKLVGRLDDGRSRVIADWFPNLITSEGLERWGTGPVISVGSVGSGTASAASGDTQLQSWVADHTAISSQTYAKTNVSPYYGVGRVDFTFGPLGANKLISEVGVGWGTQGTLLFSRARVKNAAGVNTTVTWLAGETLYLYFEARSYPFLDDSAYSGVSVTGVGSVSGIIRPMTLSSLAVGYFHNNAHSMTAHGEPAGTVTASAYSGAIGISTGSPVGSRTRQVSSVEDAYLSGSNCRSGSATWNASVGALTINSFGLSPTTHPYQMSITTITKPAGGVLVLNFQSGFWYRYT